MSLIGLMGPIDRTYMSYKTHVPMQWLLLIVLLSPLYGLADWKAIQREDSCVTRGKVKVSELVISDGSRDAQLSFVCFGAADVRLESVSNVQRQFRGLADVVESTAAVAGVNGGYFDERLRPI
jgi:hypothetical protein